MAKFSIGLEDKPHLQDLMSTNKDAFKEIVGTFVGLMEVAAQKHWQDLPNQLQTSLSFKEIVHGTLNAVLTTKEINPDAYTVLENDIHPLALLSDQRKDVVTGETSPYDWKRHFALDKDELSQDTIERIIRQQLYLVRWYDVAKISEALISNQFPVVDDKDIMKLPFQPALKYQKNHLGDLHVGKFFHDVGLFSCGELDKETTQCPACIMGELEIVHEKYKGCIRCNSGFTIKEDLEF